MARTASQVLERTVTLTVYDGTKSEDEVLQTIEDRVPARQYTVQEIDLLSRRWVWGVGLKWDACRRAGTLE